MDRIRAEIVSAEPPAPPLLSLPQGYPVAQGTAGSAGTIFTPYMYVMLAEEIRNVIVAAGITPDLGSMSQLAQAVQALISASSLGSVIDLADMKPANTPGGTFTAGAWQTRAIVELWDPAGVCEVVNNTITLQPGTYTVDIDCPATQVGTHQARLWDVTTGQVAIVGTSERGASGDGNTQHSRIAGGLVVATPKSFLIQHYCTTTRATDGFGYPAGTDGAEVYTKGLLLRLGGV